jgi:hypothetical protein
VQRRRKRRGGQEMEYWGGIYNKKMAEKVNRTVREGEGRKVEHGGGGEGWMIKEY